jgi:galactokinase/mevalonate kinase-like predicted kinase
MSIYCKHIPVSEKFVKAFERRTILLYTGRQRLAKDTLINALRKCALTPVASNFDETKKRRSVLLRLTSEAQGAMQNLESMNDESDPDAYVERLAATMNS